MIRCPLRSIILAIGAWAMACTSTDAADWPRLLGPNHDCTTEESGLIREFPSTGLKVLWEAEKGSGFGGPAIVGQALVVFHRLDDREVIECRDAASGARRWMHAYDATYRPRYGGSTGPRTSPVIADGRVFAFGISGHLHACDLKTGKVLWHRDCFAEFAMQPTFFGFGSTPLVMGKTLVVQVGGMIDGQAVNTVGLEVETGKLLWTAKHAWGASYASPIPAEIHGRSCVLVYAGGESRPPTGGLLVIDAKDGTILSAFPHRADVAESVNASSPVRVDAQRVFVSEAYTAGGACTEIDAAFRPRAAWTSENFGMYWMTPLVKDGGIYGFAGMNERLAELVCYDGGTGKEQWRTDLGGGFARASLLRTADGILCLGEFGDLAWLDLSLKGAKVLSRTKLFHAPETWTLPAISDGRLYVCQHEPGRGGTKPRLICYDFRKP